MPKKSKSPLAPPIMAEFTLAEPLYVHSYGVDEWVGGDHVRSERVTFDPPKLIPAGKHKV